MQLTAILNTQLIEESSYFRKALLREDLGRLARVEEFARSQADPAAFVDAASKLGWTPDDRRTHELKPALEPLLLAILAEVRGGEGGDVWALWQAFDRLRMDRLVGCLARVPPPTDD